MELYIIVLSTAVASVLGFYLGGFLGLRCPLKDKTSK
jgi:hypothetical protein